MYVSVGGGGGGGGGEGGVVGKVVQSELLHVRAFIPHILVVGYGKSTYPRFH